MTASKLSRIQGRIAAAEAERAVLARAKSLAAAAPAPKAKAAPTPQAIPPHIQALIAHAEAKASAPAMSPAVKAAPVAPVATRKASVPSILSDYSIPSPTLSEAAFRAALPAEVRGVTLLNMTAMRYYEENQ